MRTGPDCDYDKQNISVATFTHTPVAVNKFMVSTLSLGTLGLLMFSLTATLYQRNHDRNHNQWNIAVITVSPITTRSEPSRLSTIAKKSAERYWTTDLLIQASLCDLFHSGLVIGLRSTVLAFGRASVQFSMPRTNN